MKNRLPRVGLVAWQALPAILSSNADSDPTSTHSGLRYGETFGGLETAMWTLASHLARRGEVQPVCFVESDRHGDAKGPWPTRVDGVELQINVQRFRATRHAVGECVDWKNRRLKRFSPHLLWQIPALAITHPFRDRDPIDCEPDPRLVDHAIDAWISFGVNAASSRVVATAQKNSQTPATPTFVSVRSNAGLADELATDEVSINECGESSVARRYALMQADHVICQSEWQIDRLQQIFHREGLLARNPIDRHRWQSDRGSLPPCDVLWIGRYDDFHKRPLLMLEVARRCPKLSFTMVINPFDAAIEQRVRREAPSNVRLIDRVPFAGMPALFASAHVFASTGSIEHEGFPNVLLQAAASHTPIVSLSDHDQFLTRSGAGFACAESIDAMVAGIGRQIAEPSIDWESVDRYLDQHHDADTIAANVSTWVQDAITAAQRCASD